MFRRIHMSRNNRWFAGVGVLVASMALTAVGAEAVPINFGVGVGGSVSYDGGSNPLVITDAPVSTVDNETTSLPITGGLLNLSTGNFTSGIASTSGFQSTYAGGGSLTLVGNIGSGVTTLLSASFLGPVTFGCCLLGSSSLSGLLAVNSVDATLASLLGFNLPATGGALGLVQLFEIIPTAPGVAFSGFQAGGAITVVDVIPLPPAVFLMGSGLAGLVGLQFCRSKR